MTGFLVSYEFSTMPVTEVIGLGLFIYLLPPDGSGGIQRIAHFLGSAKSHKFLISILESMYSCSFFYISILSFSNRHLFQ